MPLKTYLPDGDIDLTAFSNDQNFKDSWVHDVRNILLSEGIGEDAEFRVKEVQYIQAEVCASWKPNLLLYTPLCVFGISYCSLIAGEDHKVPSGKYCG